MDGGERFQSGRCGALGSSPAGVLFVLGTSAASFFQALSPGIVTWRRIAALAGLIIQGMVGFFMAVFYSFGALFGSGLWLVDLGFVIMMVGTFLH